MERYARGDPAAFADVYDAIGHRILALLLRLCGRRSVAEDLTQQTFLQMHAARATYVTGSDVMAWAFAIARRLEIDRRRRVWREVPEESGVEDIRGGATRPDDALIGTETLQRLTAALASLPENQRVAFQLLKLDGLSLAQAAEVLGVTVTAVKLRAHRAYEALRKILGEDP
jgi:RNA polymerase sigma-70 factor (ECF subfamily)